MQLTIPVLEAHYKVWYTHADRPKYSLFTSSLHVACQKIDEYYEKTTASPAYVMSMSMNPFS